MHAAGKVASEAGVKGELGLSLSTGVSGYYRGSASVEAGGRYSDSSQDSREESTSITQADSGKLVLGEDGALSVTGQDGSRYSQKFSEGESRQVLESQSGEDRATMLYAASNDYQEAVQAQQRASEEYTTSRSGSLPIVANPQAVAGMKNDSDIVRDKVDGQMRADEAEIIDQGAAVKGTVGANIADVSERASHAEASTSPIGSRGVSGLSIDSASQLNDIQANANAPVVRPDNYHAIDTGDSFTVADRRDLAAADASNADALVTGGERTNIQVGNDTFVPALFTQDESGHGQAVYAVEREGGHAYYQYGGDGSFEPISIDAPPSQSQIDYQASNGPAMNATEASITRIQIRSGGSNSNSTNNESPPGQGEEIDPREFMTTR